MRLEIVHATRYRYSGPVFLEPHVLRFRPRSNSWQRLVSFELDIMPRPVSTSQMLDVEGNESTITWFDLMTNQLELHTRALVETLRENPFDFLWIGESRLPVQYESHLKGVLEPYRRHESTPQLREYADSVATAGGDAQSFLMQLTSALHASYRHIVRPEGDPWPPEETLQRSEGSCRDLGVLYVALCREMGFAARFVSGYCAVDEVVGENELHAWAEVYLPGGGWRGFDPSTGLAVTDRHVAVAAGASSEDAAPITGTFRGSAGALPIETALTVRVLD